MESKTFQVEARARYGGGPANDFFPRQIDPRTILRSKDGRVAVRPKAPLEITIGPIRFALGIMARAAWNAGDEWQHLCFRFRWIDGGGISSVPNDYHDAYGVDA